MAVMIGGKPYVATMDVTNGNMSFVLFAGKVIQGNYPTYRQVDLPTDTGYLLVSSQYVMGCPQLSRDGTRIAFQSDRTGKTASEEKYPAWSH